MKFNVRFSAKCFFISKFLQGSKEYLKKEEQVDKFTQGSIKRLCEILDIEKKGTKVKRCYLCIIRVGNALKNTEKHRFFNYQK